MPEYNASSSLQPGVLEEDSMRNKYLLFPLGEQRFALPIRYVVDIIRVQPVTPVPNCPDFLLGVINLRGQVIPVIDLRLRFGKPRRESDSHTCIVVVERREILAGLLVDSVSEVGLIPEGSVSPPPAFADGTESRYLQGIGATAHGTCLILDCGTILGEPPEEE